MDVCLGALLYYTMYARSDRLRKDREGGGGEGGGSRGGRREKQDEDEDEEQDVERLVVLATRMPSPKFNQGSEVARTLH